MKKAFIVAFLTASIVISFYLTNVNVSKLGTTVRSLDSRLIQDSKEEMYKDAIITLLLPFVEKAVDDYYNEYLIYNPQVQPWYIEVLDLKRISKAELFVKLEVKPFLGAHFFIGRDQITFRIQAYNGDPKVEKYEHIESYEIPQHLKNNIKKWPPQ